MASCEKSKSCKSKKPESESLSPVSKTSKNRLNPNKSNILNDTKNAKCNISTKNAIGSKERESHKRKPDPQPDNEKSIEIKSANSWEDVDLGSTDRNAKFLKLMGAANRKQQGIFHIGQSNTEKHTKAGENLSQLDESMKKQFDYGIDQRLSHSHQGIGSKLDSTASSSSTAPFESQSSANKYKINFIKGDNS